MPIDAAANRPTERTLAQPLQAPTAAAGSPAAPANAKATHGVVSDLFEAASTVPTAARAQGVEKALSLLLGGFGLTLPDPNNPAAFWQSVEKASTTPVDPN